MPPDEIPESCEPREVVVVKSAASPEDLADYQRYAETLTLVPEILIQDPTDPEVNRVPGDWQSLDAVVEARGTRFEEFGEIFDIAADVEGQLGKGKLALLILRDPSTPRLPTPEERAVARITAEERAAAGLPPERRRERM
jgi:hypothetical protein